MTAPHDAEAGAAKQQQDGRGDAGAVRNVTLEQRDQAVRMLFAFRARPGAAAMIAQPLAQQHGRANGGRFQVSLGSRRSHRPGEASCTIHCTSSSNVPANAASSGTSDVLVMPGWVSTSMQKRPPVPSMRASTRKSARLHAPAAKRQNAPPALTFGLPGKQMVNSVEAGCDLIRLLSTLLKNP